MIEVVCGVILNGDGQVLACQEEEKPGKTTPYQNFEVGDSSPAD